MKTRGAMLAGAGGLAWLAKIGVIAATDGRVTDTGAAAVFFLAGVVLMPLGSAVLAVWLTAGRHVAVRATAAVGAAVVFFAAFSVLEGVARSLVGDAGPAWLPDEAGILVTGVAWMLLGAAALRARSGPAVATA